MNYNMKNALECRSFNWDLSMEEEPSLKRIDSPFDLSSSKRRKLADEFEKDVPVGSSSECPERKNEEAEKGNSEEIKEQGGANVDVRKDGAEMKMRRVVLLKLEKFIVQEMMVITYQIL